MKNPHVKADIITGKNYTEVVYIDKPFCDITGTTFLHCRSSRFDFTYAYEKRTFIQLHVRN